MTSRDFCYWLQGRLEISPPETLNKDEVAIIRNHLNLVFMHEIDPSMPDPTGLLQAAHAGKPYPSEFGGSAKPILRC